MAKIVLVEQDKVSIGMDDGAIKEVRTDDLNFVPHVGDEVEVFETESRTIISKKEQKKDAVPEGGIHINLSNAQNIGAGQVQCTGQGGQKTGLLPVGFLFGLGRHP